MRVTGLDGRAYPWTLVGYMPLESDERPRSANHLRARGLLARLYPLEPRLEEVPLPGSDGLSCDFYLPRRCLMVEVHGEQHYEYNSFFHATRLDFLRGQANDRRKLRWCELNSITLVELPHDERDDAWAQRIIAATTADADGPAEG